MKTDEAEDISKILSIYGLDISKKKRIVEVYIVYMRHRRAAEYVEIIKVYLCEKVANEYAAKCNERRPLDGHFKVKLYEAS